MSGKLNFPWNALAYGFGTISNARDWMSGEGEAPEPTEEQTQEAAREAEKRKSLCAVCGAGALTIATLLRPCEHVVCAGCAHQMVTTHWGKNPTCCLCKAAVVSFEDTATDLAIGDDGAAAAAAGDWNKYRAATAAEGPRA